MSSQNWDRVIQIVMDSAGEYPTVQLQLLLMRLKKHPEVIPTIADAVRDMGNWYLEQSAGLEAVGDLQRIVGDQSQGDR